MARDHSGLLDLSFPGCLQGGQDLRSESRPHGLVVVKVCNVLVHMIEACSHWQNGQQNCGRHYVVYLRAIFKLCRFLQHSPTLLNKFSADDSLLTAFDKVKSPMWVRVRHEASCYERLSNTR